MMDCHLTVRKGHRDLDPWRPAAPIEVHVLAHAAKAYQLRKSFGLLALRRIGPVPPVAASLTADVRGQFSSQVTVLQDLVAKNKLAPIVWFLAALRENGAFPQHH